MRVTARQREARDFDGSARESDRRRREHLELGPGRGDFEAGGSGAIPDEGVRSGERAEIHRSALGNAGRREAKARRSLDRGGGAPGENAKNGSSASRWSWRDGRRGELAGAHAL